MQLPKIKRLQKNMKKNQQISSGTRSIFRVEENKIWSQKTFLFELKQHSRNQIISLDVVILVYHKTDL